MTSKYSLKSVNLEIDSKVESLFSPHPFSDIKKSANYECLMENYLAMSQAFPYLQAGSQKDVFWSFMEENEDVPEHVELTSVVGNFLCWDETGGLYPTMAMQLKALPHILETHRFHSNILKQDCTYLFGKNIKPNYSEVTKKYLKNLYDALSSPCRVTRVAGMVSFESHANNMIQALWENVSNTFSTVDRNNLVYFRMHVGGNDPAEKYHVEMTNSLISKVVKENEFPLFIRKFLDSYALHYTWCRDITKLSELQMAACI